MQAVASYLSRHFALKFEYSNRTSLNLAAVLHLMFPVHLCLTMSNKGKIYTKYSSQRRKHSSGTFRQSKEEVILEALLLTAMLV